MLTTLAGFPHFSLMVDVHDLGWSSWIAGTKLRPICPHPAPSCPPARGAPDRDVAEGWEECSGRAGETGMRRKTKVRGGGSASDGKGPTLCVSSQAHSIAR